MSFRELAPISNRLSWMSTRLPGSAVSQMFFSFSSISLRAPLSGPLAAARS